MTQMDCFAVIDTETTGLPDDLDARVIELGAALFSLTDGLLVRSFSTLVCPDAMLTEEGLAVAAEVSGITEAQIKAAPSPAEAWAACGVFLDGWSYPVHAFNLEFDRLMCERTFDTEGVWWAGCIMEEFSLLWVRCFGHDPTTGKPVRCHLRRAARIADVRWEGDTHRAEADAIVAGRIFALLRANKLQPPEQTVPTRVITIQGRAPRRDPSVVVIGPLVIGSGKAPSITRADTGEVYVPVPRPPAASATPVAAPSPQAPTIIQIGVNKRTRP